MTQKEFEELFIECSAKVIDLLYPKNETAASGGAASPGRGTAMLESGALCCKLTDALRERGIISGASDETAAIPDKNV